MSAFSRKDPKKLTALNYEDKIKHYIAQILADVCQLNSELTVEEEMTLPKSQDKSLRLDFVLAEHSLKSMKIIEVKRPLIEKDYNGNVRQSFQD